MNVTFVELRQTGGPEVLTVASGDLAEPKADEAVVRVEAAGVNFIDVYRRTGLYEARLPLTLGSEGAGTVVSVGRDAHSLEGGLAIGARVAWADVAGSYATHVVAKADRLVPVPDAVDLKRAAAVMLQGMTAHYLAMDTFALGPRHDCIVHAAAGGVGLLLCQIAKHAGARVIGTVGSEEKAELARAAGASEVVLYRTQDFEAEAKRLTNGRGVHVVYDSVGKDTWEKSMRSLARRGLLVLFGNSSGAVPPIAPLLLSKHGSLFLTRPTLGDYVITREDLLRRASDLFAWIAAGTLDVRVDRALPLADAAEAHRLLEGRRARGKLLLLP
jgi:NADPH2:quinone reductase